MTGLAVVATSLTATLWSRAARTLTWRHRRRLQQRRPLLRAAGPDRGLRLRQRPAALV